MITNRFAEVEAELESFANLYVASFQLHSSLARARGGAPRQGAARSSSSARRVAGHLLRRRGRAPPRPDRRPTGIELASALPSIASQRRRRRPPIRWSAVIERTFLTGVPHIAEGEVASLRRRPASRFRSRTAPSARSSSIAARAEGAVRHGRPRALQAARRARRRRRWWLPTTGGSTGGQLPSARGATRRMCVEASFVANARGSL